MSLRHTSAFAQIVIGSVSWYVAACDDSPASSPPAIGFDSGLPSDAAADAGSAFAQRLATLVVGPSSVCAVTAGSGRLYCMGNASDGVFMDELPESALGAVACRGTSSGERGLAGWRRVPFAGSVEQVAVSQHARCLIHRGAVSCWGGNEHGELGHAPGTAGDRRCREGRWCKPAPSAPEGLPADTFDAVYAGADYFCAKTAAGALYCWGDNRSAQLAREPSPSGLPARVELMGTVNRVALGLDTACAIERGSRLLCWGNNQGGAVLASDAPLFAKPQPRPDFLPIGVDSLAVNVDGGCITYGGPNITNCWGNNRTGQLGSLAAVGTFQLASTSSPRLREVQLGRSAGVGVFWENGPRLLAWGAGPYGGLASLPNPQPQSPVVSPSLDGVQRLFFGLEENGVAVRGRDMFAWGRNGCGQLGHAPGTAGDGVCDEGEPCNGTPSIVASPEGE
jgi:alpha-tubulin suppressor-like RCC1 family protein